MDHTHSHSMGGMGVGVSNDYQPLSKYITVIFWGLIAALVSVGLIGNILSIIDARLRKKRARNASPYPTKPQNWFWQIDATVRALLREASYPQLWLFQSKPFSYFTPPSLGKLVAIFFYWVTITICLTTNSIYDKSNPFYFESLGFRGAWISLMQVPLIILLSGRTNVVAFFLGHSSESLNWAHRWVSRTLLISVTVHAAFFLRQWIRADFLATQLQILPMVKYGMGAAGVLLWMNIIGLPIFRAWFYEIFYLQHLASIAIFLYLLYVHVPLYAFHFIWLSFALIAFDRLVRLGNIMYRNVSFRSKTLGYSALIQNAPGNVVKVTVDNVSFRWQPGQHVYISIPSLGLFESHPFTIANACPKSGDLVKASVELHARSHSKLGFTGRLSKAAREAGVNGRHLRTLLQGPYGCVPDWQSFDTLVLIAASTGSSYTLPILESVLNDPGCVRVIRFIHLVRRRSQCSCAMARLRALAKAARPDIDVQIQVFVTQGTLMNGETPHTGDMQACCCVDDSMTDKHCFCGAGDGENIEILNYNDKVDQVSFTSSFNHSSHERPTAVGEVTIIDDEKATSTVQHVSSTNVSLATSSQAISKSNRVPPSQGLVINRDTGPKITIKAEKPILNHTIRTAVEKAHGETCVVVCSGRPLSRYVRNTVTALSDERAVHKGTGAQGIRLVVEEYSF